jgi:GNAT superfamily N-acetyltransferase
MVFRAHHPVRYVGTRLARGMPRAQVFEELRHYASDARLRDGRRIHIRAIRPDDRDLDETTPPRAELAVAVRDDDQGLGVGSALLARLLQIAVARGLRRFEADVLEDNEPILRMIRHSGLAFESFREEGVRHVSLKVQRHAGFAAREKSGRDADRGKEDPAPHRLGSIVVRPPSGAPFR